MSAKRVTSSAIDWAAFAAKVPKDQHPQFKNFKVKADTYLRSVAALPESLPKINWDQYSTRIAIPGMVDNFKKTYETLQISYPQDTYTEKVNEVEKTARKEVAEFVKNLDEVIAKRNVDLKKWIAMIPPSEMTMEEFYEAFPEQGIDLENPTFYPHTPETQPGYWEEKEKAEAH